MSARLRALQALRLKLHRIEPSCPLPDARAAVAFVKERRIITGAARSSLPALTETIAGRPLAGSWMAHPEAHRIYRIWGRVARAEVLTAPLVLGKETLATSVLGPVIERIASDLNRCRMARDDLTPLARRLLEQVETRGQVRMDRWDLPTKQARPARLLLERALLVVSTGMHTERGYHTTILTPWSASRLAIRFSRAASHLTIEEAQDRLLLAAIRSAVVAPEREVRAWFVFGDGRVKPLLAQGKLERLTVAGRDWLTCRQ